MRSGPYGDQWGRKPDGLTLAKVMAVGQYRVGWRGDYDVRRFRSDPCLGFHAHHDVAAQPVSKGFFADLACGYAEHGEHTIGIGCH